MAYSVTKFLLFLSAAVALLWGFRAIVEHYLLPHVLRGKGVHCERVVFLHGKKGRFRARKRA